METNSRSVDQLSRLIDVSHTANINEIVKLIASDNSLKARTIRIARNGRPDGDDMDLDVAINRLGTGIVEILAMGNILMVSVLSTFKMMLNTLLMPVDPASLVRDEKPTGIVGAVEFNGVVYGKIYLDFPRESTRWLASTMTGIPESSLSNDIEMDAIGEIVNIIAGKLQSNICDAGLKCHLGLPNVDQARLVPVEKISGAKKETFAFRTNEHIFWIDFIVNPYANR